MANGAEQTIDILIHQSMQLLLILGPAKVNGTNLYRLWPMRKRIREKKEYNPDQKKENNVSENLWCGSDNMNASSILINFKDMCFKQSGWKKMI